MMSLRNELVSASWAEINLNVTDEFMRIGLLSDTRGFLDGALITSFQDCDEIWHAGDFGTPEVLDQLQRVKPVRGVFLAMSTVLRFGLASWRISNGAARIFTST